MDLQQEIDARRAEIRSDNYGMSIGELISLYKDEELDIHPEFQRFYHWSVGQKSRLIESLLLGIPIPPIFVFQRSDGVWDVVDGLQRLSAIFEFVGILRDESRNLKPPLILEKTKYLPSLEHVAWDSSNLSKHETLQTIQNSLIEDENSQPKTLTESQRLRIKRARIQLLILLKESDERARYDLFQRLNTGGSSLSSQELRNCILISTNLHMYEWLRRLSHNENFTSCVSLTDRAIDEQYDVELVLRFLVFRNLDDEALTNIGDIADFLTEKMENMAFSKDFDMEKEGRYFTETFELLARTTNSNSFRRYDPAKGRFLGGFLASAFEAVSLGIGYNLDLIRREQIDIEEKVKQLWQMQDFTGSASSGIRASTRTSQAIPLCRRLFRP
jgi:hypothetical protein